MIKTFTQLLHFKAQQKGMKTALIIADVLSISQDASYRRMRSPLTFKADELMKLAAYFNIDLNSLMNLGNNWFQGEFRQINASYTRYDFFNDLRQYLQKAIDRPNSYISYGAREIPFFYDFWFPTLSAFKSFVYSRDFLNDHTLRNSTFTASLRPSDKKLEQLSIQYMNISGEEIWSYETLFSTLYQIKHYKECGLFANQFEYNAVLDEYDLLIDHIHEQAERGKKLHPFQPNLEGADYQLYFTPLVNSDNSIVINTHREQQVIVCSQMNGVLISDCEQWVNSVKHWFEISKSNGTLLSVSGSGPRSKFLRQEYLAKKKMLGLNHW